MSDDHEAADAHRQQDLYFNELFQLTVQCRYMRRYRNILARRVRQLEILRAVASSGAIATWAVVRAYPMIWAGIIAASQLTDALKDVIPFTSRHKAANGLVVSLDALLIETLYKWEGVYKAQFTNEEITSRGGSGTLPDRRSPGARRPSAAGGKGRRRLSSNHV